MKKFTSPDAEVDDGAQVVKRNGGNFEQLRKFELTVRSRQVSAHQIVGRSSTVDRFLNLQEIRFRR